MQGWGFIQWAISIHGVDMRSVEFDQGECCFARSVLSVSLTLNEFIEACDGGISANAGHFALPERPARN